MCNKQIKLLYEEEMNKMKEWNKQENKNKNNKLNRY